MGTHTAGPAALSVDDIPDNRVILATLLEFHGLAVQQAQDGSEAVVLAARDPPALIPMDIAMPVMDGWEAARLLRQDARTASTPIVAVTAADLHSEFDRLREGGFSGYVRKPFSPRQVVEVVRECLRDADEDRPWIERGHIGIGTMRL